MQQKWSMHLWLPSYTTTNYDNRWLWMYSLAPMTSARCLGRFLLSNITPICWLSLSLWCRLHIECFQLSIQVLFQRAWCRILHRYKWICCTTIPSTHQWNSWLSESEIPLRSRKCMAHSRIPTYTKRTCSRLPSCPSSRWKHSAISTSKWRMIMYFSTWSLLPLVFRS